MNAKTEGTFEFSELKQIVLSAIKNAECCIGQQGSYQGPGIYLLYIDNFQDEKIIPFYIGKSKNVQRRYRNHIEDVKRLIQYGYENYHDEFFWSAVGRRRIFDGKYRPCKILKYLVDHDCTFDDVKMVVLEKCLEEHLDEREEYYLSLYLPAFFGFNQISTITEQFAYRNDSAGMRSIIEKDYRYFQMYMEYGYSIFNYLHGFLHYGSNELNQVVNQLIANHRWPTSEELLSRAASAFENYRKVYNEIYSCVSDRFAGQVHDIFEKCKLKSKGREGDVLAAFTIHIRAPVLNEVSANLDYLEYYFDRDKRSRECGEMIKALYHESKNDINQIVVPVQRAFNEYLDSRNQAIEQSRYSLIFPKKSF